MSAATPCLEIDGKLQSLCLGFLHFLDKMYPFYRSVGSSFKGEMLLQYSFVADISIFLLQSVSCAKAAEKLHLAADSVRARCSRSTAVAPCCASGSKHWTISAVSDAFPSSSSCK